MNKLLTSNQNSLNQGKLNDYRVATGMFSNHYSIGLTLDSRDTVIQSISMDESDDGESVIIFASIDNRAHAKANLTARTVHHISRVKLPLKTMGSSDSRTGQNLTSTHAYYSNVDQLNYNGTTIDMNWYPEGTDAEEDDSYKKRFELEGIKKIKGLTSIGIPNGWYVSAFSKYAFKNALAEGTTDYKKIPWKKFIYKLQTTPIIVWDGKILYN
jgi:hypothetical protein